jgi:hypothetical protein
VSGGVIEAFVRRMLVEELPQVRAASDVLHLAPDPYSGDPPRRLHGLFTKVEHLVPGPGNTFLTSHRPLPFAIEYMDDYCSCCDGTLQLRVARVLAPIAHPNISPGGVVCLGGRFRPSTRLRPLLEHVHRICSARVYASHSPWDAKTADFYRQHPERVRALRSAPLWRQAVAQGARVDALEAARATR